MKASNPALDAVLASRQAFIASLFTLTLANGSILRLTSAPDFDVVWGGHTYNRAYVIDHGDVTTSIGTEVDEIDVTLFVRPDDVIFGLPVPQFVLNRGFDGAKVLIERAFMATPGVPAGVVHLFEGEILEPSPSRTMITMKATSGLFQLNRNVPRNTITPGCSNILFDAERGGLCAANRSVFTHTGSAASGSTQTVILSSLPQANGYYTQGTIEFTSGANAGAKRTVKKFTGGDFTVVYPFFYPVEAGDTFTASAGCNRLRSTCRDKFNQESNFRGFEKVPSPVNSV